MDNHLEDFSGYIIGAGLKFDKQKSFPKAKILAIRGELTRVRIGANKNTPLGNSGLLVTLLNKKEQKKIIGFEPHFFDKNDNKVPNF